VAQDDDVALPRLVGARLRQIEEQRRAIERRLAELRSNKQRLAQLETVLAEYDHGAYLRAAARLMAETRIAPLAERTAELTIEAQRARSRVTSTERTFLHGNYSGWHGG
jgi:DNA repair exonuclease SbcCD ATPase subunit